MKKFLAIVLTMISGVVCAANLDAIRIQYHLPALGAALLKDGVTTTYISGVRKWGDSTPATAEDVFHLGSETKAMTATLIAIYVEKGLLRWDMTLAEAFPNLPMNSQYRDVTLKMLTAHRSGVPADLSLFNNGRLWARLYNPALNPVTGRRMVVYAVLTSPPATIPGSQFEYSNTNYMIAGAILEQVTGKSWEQLMRDDLFTPLQMNSCGFGAAGDPLSSVPTQPYPHREDAHHRPVPVPLTIYADNPPTLGPAGTVHCSMQDWAKFLQVHMDGYNGKDTVILKAESFKMLHTPYPGQDYTPGGWYLEQRDWAGGPVLTHVGSNLLNYAVTWVAPLKNMALMSVTNIGDDNADGGTDAAIEAISP